MSSGRVHFQYGSVVLAGTLATALGLALVETGGLPVEVRLPACLGLVCGSVVGLVCSPDVDLRHNYSRYRLRRKFPIFGGLIWLWFLPFALGRHRGISHTTLGTLMRWAWMWWIPLAVAVVLAAPLLPYISLFLLAALLGQGAQDTTHLLLDR